MPRSTTSVSFSIRSEPMMTCPALTSFADADNGGIGESGGRRNSQALEGPLPFLTRDGLQAERVQIVGEEDGCRFTKPEDLDYRGRYVERHHQCPRIGCDRQCPERHGNDGQSDPAS